MWKRPYRSLFLNQGSRSRDELMGDEAKQNGTSEPEAAEQVRRATAEEYRLLGEQRHAAGDSAEATGYHQMSLDLLPTPEAHLALARAMAERGLYDEAIAECQDAIKLDPNCGNPYN